METSKKPQLPGTAADNHFHNTSEMAEFSLCWLSVSDFREYRFFSDLYVDGLIVYMHKNAISLALALLFCLSYRLAMFESLEKGCVITLNF